MSEHNRAIREAKPRARRTARADKVQETERRLIDAAAKVVGAEGYASASVAKITSLAEVAQGTFYNYFASQQDLFDHLLPEIGGEMLEFIRERLSGIDDSFAREEAGFRAFFEFLQIRPEFYRILNEAETFSPKAFGAHMRNMAAGYLRALSRSHAKGEMPGFSDRELEVVVYALLAARNYLAYRFAAIDGRARPLPGWVVDAYMKLVTGGMRFGGTDKRIARAKAKSVEDARPAVSNPSFRIVEQAAGHAEIEVEVNEASLASGGRVRPAGLMELMEAAGALAAGGASAKGEARLESMSVSFIGSSSARRLIASARMEGGAAAVHIALRVTADDAEGEALAIGQAVYAVGSRDGGGAA